MTKPMTFNTDLVLADDDTLAGLADRAFRLGLLDGRTLSGPIRSDRLINQLPGHPMRTVHRRKLQQVYSAGFEIAQANKFIVERELSNTKETPR